MTSKSVRSAPSELELCPNINILDMSSPKVQVLDKLAQCLMIQ
jgi:Leucine-rich repeat (LRR) protein